MKPSKERLQAAKALITDPEKWGRWVYARRADGQSVEPWSLDAERFCALGALMRVHGRVPEEKVLSECCQELFHQKITDVNDNLGHRAVLEAYDCAIKKCEVIE